MAPHGEMMVPFAGLGWRKALEAESALEKLIARFGDRMVRIAEDALGEELDARIARIAMHPNEAGVDPFSRRSSTASTSAPRCTASIASPRAG